jgi:hypothetical protein
MRMNDRRHSQHCHAGALWNTIFSVPQCTTLKEEHILMPGPVLCSSLLKLSMVVTAWIAMYNFDKELLCYVRIGTQIALVSNKTS